jgi:hypothetical protein
VLTSLETSPLLRGSVCPHFPLCPRGLHLSPLHICFGDGERCGMGGIGCGMRWWWRTRNGTVEGNGLHQRGTQIPTIWAWVTVHPPLLKVGATRAPFRWNGLFVSGIVASLSQLPILNSDCACDKSLNAFSLMIGYHQPL